MAISAFSLPVEIKNSTIHGKGVFSKRKIKKGDVVGLIMMKTKGSGDPDKIYTRTIIGKYLNHSANPNALVISTKKGYALAARQDIPANTELLVDYEEFQKLSGIPQRIPLSKRASEVNEKKNAEIFREIFKKISPMFSSSSVNWEFDFKENSWIKAVPPFPGGFIKMIFNKNSIELYIDLYDYEDKFRYYKYQDYQELVDRIRQIVENYEKKRAVESKPEAESDLEWEKFIEDILERGSAERPRGPIPDFVRKSLNEFLRDEFILEEKGRDYVVAVRRWLGNGPRVGTWLHVVNKKVDSFKNFIRSFKNIKGEVAASDPYDYLLHRNQGRHSPFLAIILKGKANAVFDVDVYSNVDEYTGRRFADQYQVGEPRTEAWISPDRSQIIAIATNVPEFKKEAEELGFKVYFIGVHGFSKYYHPEHEFEYGKDDYREFPEKYKGRGFSARASKYVEKKKEESDNITYTMSTEDFTKAMLIDVLSSNQVDDVHSPGSIMADIVVGLESLGHKDVAREISNSKPNSQDQRIALLKAGQLLDIPGISQLLETKPEWTPNGWVVKGALDITGLGLTTLKYLNIYEVGGSFFCSNNQLTSLQGAPQKVSGGFFCSNNSLTTLQGAPQKVGGGFFCPCNQLTSLQGAPQKIGGDFYCSNNQLTSLQGAPQKVGGSFYCSSNSLTSLQGGPQEVGDNFFCSRNQLTSLQGAPQKVGGGFFCHNNQLTSLQGAPQKVGGGFSCDNNPLDEEKTKESQSRFSISKRASNYLKKKKEESGNITYIYSDKHVEERNKKKAKKLDKLSKNINKVRKQVSTDLKSDDLKNKYNALAVGLIDDTYERVGNRYSAEDMSHYGVTTWLKKHIKFTGGTAVIKYVGKSGVKQDKKITNKKLIPVLKEITQGKKANDPIFKGEDYYITDNSVNAYLKPFDITAKDIRGFHANEEMRKELKKVRKGNLPKDQKEKEKKLKEEFKKALENTAKIVGHEAGTLKNQYLIPGLEKDYTTRGKIASNFFALSKRATYEELTEMDSESRREQNIREIMEENFPDFPLNLLSGWDIHVNDFSNVSAYLYFPAGSYMAPAKLVLKKSKDLWGNLSWPTQIGDFGLNPKIESNINSYFIEFTSTKQLKKLFPVIDNMGTIVETMREHSQRGSGEYELQPVGKAINPDLTKLFPRDLFDGWSGSYGKTEIRMNYSYRAAFLAKAHGLQVSAIIRYPGRVKIPKELKQFKVSDELATNLDIYLSTWKELEKLAYPIVVVLDQIGNELKTKKEASYFSISKRASTMSTEDFTKAMLIDVLSSNQVDDVRSSGSTMADIVVGLESLGHKDVAREISNSKPNSQDQRIALLKAGVLLDIPGISQLLETKPEWTPNGWVVKDRLDISGLGLTTLKYLNIYEVGGSFFCSRNQLTSLQGAPQKVGGGFFCHNNQLTSLQEAPQKVGGNFLCYNNQLTSLQGAPQKVSGGFHCHNNQLTSLQGAPQEVGDSFLCHNNQLTSLQGAPQKVGGSFFCHNNQLTSLQGAPQKVGGSFFCHNNQLTSLQGAPQEVGDGFSCDNNPLDEEKTKESQSRFSISKRASTMSTEDFTKAMLIDVLSSNQVDDVHSPGSTMADIVVGLESLGYEDVAREISNSKPNSQDQRIALLKAGQLLDIPGISQLLETKPEWTPNGWVVKDRLDISALGLTTLKYLNIYEVGGDFFCDNNQLTSLQGAPQKVGGDFFCYDNQLTSLQGGPQEVGGSFYCSYNQLTSLQGAPQKVGGDFFCYNNQLTSLQGAPQKVGGSFYCSNNSLTSLQGGPQEVGDDFFCNNNSLTTLQGAPQKVGGGFFCYNNQLTSLQGAPQEVGGDFSFENNPLNEEKTKESQSRFSISKRAEEERVDLREYFPLSTFGAFADPSESQWSITHYSPTKINAQLHIHDGTARFHSFSFIDHTGKKTEQKYLFNLTWPKSLGMGGRPHKWGYLESNEVRYSNLDRSEMEELVPQIQHLIAEITLKKEQEEKSEYEIKKVFPPELFRGWEYLKYELNFMEAGTSYEHFEVYFDVSTAVLDDGTIKHYDLNNKEQLEELKRKIREIGEKRQVIKLRESSKHLLSKRAALAEEEVQRLLIQILPGTPFAGKAYSVGGYERDKLMGKESKDLDIVVEMKGGAEALAKFLVNKFPEQTSSPRQLGAAYPIWHVAFKENITYEGARYATQGAEIDIADTQKEHYPDPSSRQRETVYAPLKDDIERRDFTVNMLLRDLTSGEIKDLTGTSKEDIKRGILRGHPAIEPDTMFSNDPLRMLRLIRFQCKYDWDIPMYMLKAVRRNAEEISKISWERIQEELRKIMKMGKTAQAIKLMKATNLLPLILPEIYGMIGVKHDKRSHGEGDVYKHTLLVLSNAPPTIEGQLAALLHDVGKPTTQEFIGKKIQFLGHEKAGAEIAEAVLRRLKFDNKTIAKVKSMVENHMRPHSLEDASPKALRKFVRDVGEGMVDDILNLAEADSLGNLPPKNYIPELRKRIEKAKEIPVAKKPILSGHEVMKLLNEKPGPIIGQVGKYLLELQDELAEQGKKLTKEKAREMVIKEFASLSKRESVK